MLAPTFITIDATRKEIEGAKAHLNKLNIELPKLCVAGTLTKKQVHDTLDGQQKTIKTLEKRLKDQLNVMKRTWNK